LLSKLIGACSDQLAPFEGLWDYEKGSDYFPRTIFRFPLRTTTTTSLLRTSKVLLNSDEVYRLMSNYFEEARVSLLFLRQIKSIDFKVWGKPDSGWSVTRQLPVDEDVRSFSEAVLCSFVRNGELGAPQVAGKDKWWVAIEDPDSLPVADRLQENSRRALKNVECGIAALIYCKPNNSSASIPAPIQSRVFNTLPLPICSDLPVHINATFSLSGDRQSISIDEHGARSHGSEWNRGLLQDRLPTLYLKFLEDLGRQVRQDVFKYWPQGEPPKRSCAELLCASFWEELPGSGEKLFPKAQPITKITQRRAAQLLTIDEAVFDFLPKAASEALAPLLISLKQNLVRNIPPAISKRLKTLPEAKSVTASRLRQLLKSDQGRACLLKEMEDNPRIWEILFRQLIPADTDLDDLDSCYILPLADGTLAPLRLLGTSDAQSSSYYVASAQELELFDFASSCLVSSDTAEKLGTVFRCKKFAIEELRLVHAKKLLKMRPKVSTPNSGSDEWLIRFWQYWNKPSLEDPPDIDDIDVDIFRATFCGIELYATPAQFYGIPAVVEPSVSDHQALCDRFPSLYRFDTKFMPKTLRETEASFYREPSFYRFIKALSRIAPSNTRLGSFVQTHLDVSHLVVSFLKLTQICFSSIGE
jgi:sacsin